MQVILKDSQRMEQIEKWAKYVRTSNGKWRKVHNKFINDQFELALNFYNRLLKQPNGKGKIRKLRGIKNLNAAPFLK